MDSSVFDDSSNDSNFSTYGSCSTQDEDKTSEEAKKTNTNVVNKIINRQVFILANKTKFDLIPTTFATITNNI